MTDTASATGLTNLPPLPTTSIGSLRFLQGWLQGPARWAGWLILPLVPVFIFTTAAVYEFLANPCYYNGGGYPWYNRPSDGGCMQNAALTMGGISLFYVLLGALFLASAVAMIRRPRPSLSAAETSARLQGIKDWFIRGDIQEDDYKNLRELIQSAENPKSVGVTASRGATLLRSFAYLLLPLAVFWTFFIGIFIDELQTQNDEMSYLLNWLIGGIIFVAFFVAALVRASQLARFGAEFGQGLLRQINAAEETIMRTARTRSGARDAAPAPSGASFRPYARR